MAKRKAAYFVIPLACVLSTASVAQDSTNSPPKTPSATFSRAQIQAALEHGVDLRKVNTAPGLHSTPLSETWNTADEADVVREQIEQQRSRGFYSVDSEKMVDMRAAIKLAASQRGYVPRHDRAFRSLKDVRSDLLVKPIDLGTSALSSSTLIEVRLGGNFHKGKWTGVSRTFDVSDLGLVTLDERDHAVSKDSVTVIKEWVNTDVNGEEGTVKTARDKAGHSLVLVGWANQRKLYSLQLQPDRPEANDENQARLLEIARELVET